MQFWYHMQGSHIGNLSVFTRTNTTERLIWVQRGEQGDAWIFGETTLKEAVRFRVSNTKKKKIAAMFVVYSLLMFFLLAYVKLQIVKCVIRVFI